MSLEPSTSNGHDNVDHSSEEDRNQAVNTDLSGEKKDSRDLKFGNEVFSKYQDWDLTLTGNHESNDNVNNGDSSALLNDTPEEENIASNIVGDIPDSFSVAMSIKRAFWTSDEARNDYRIPNFGSIIDRDVKKAKHFVIFTEKPCDKKFALFALLNEIKNEDYQGIIIYVLSDAQANIIVALVGEHERQSVSIQSNHEKSMQVKAVEDFMKKKVKILVVSSAVSIDKDLPDVKIVINFDLPSCAMEYRQRIGRIGKSDIPDKVISFFDPKRDHTIANSLIDFLVENRQTIPGFLPYYCNDDSIDTNEKQATNPN